MLVRMAPDAIDRLACGPRAGLDRRQLHQRQDDDRRHDRRRFSQAAGREPIHNRAGSNMHWGVATALLEQSRRRGPLRARRGLAAARGAAAAPAPARARQPVPRPARPLRRARAARGRVGGAGGRARGILRVRPERRRPADRGPRPRPRASPPPGRHLLRDRGHDPGAARSSSTPTTRSTAAAAAPRTRTSAPSSATSATTRCPNCDADRPAPDIAATEIELHGISGSSVHDHDARGRAASWSSPSPASTTSTTRSPRVAAGLRSGVPLDQVREGLESMRAVFGRVETIEVSGKPVSILLIKNPAGRERGAPHAAPRIVRTAGIDLWLALNDRIADGRDVSWIWDADFELLADGVRRVICAGTRAPEMALRLKYAGWPQDAIEVMEPIEASARRARSRRPRAGSSPCPPTPRCSSCGRCSRSAGSRRTSGNDGSPAQHLAGGRVRLLRRRPARSGWSSPRPRAAPSLELGAGPGRVALHLAGHGHEVIARGARPRARRELERLAASSAACLDLRRRGGPLLARRGRAPRRPALVIGPLHVIQVLDAAGPSRAARAPAASSWRPGGTLALTVVDESTLLSSGRRVDPDPARHARARRLGLLERAALGPGRRRRAHRRRLRETRLPGRPRWSAPSTTRSSTGSDPDDLEREGADAGFAAPPAGARSPRARTRPIPRVVLLEAPQ